MSYYTHFHLSWNDANRAEGDLDAETLAKIAAPIVEEFGWHEQVLKDLLQAVDSSLGHTGFNRVHDTGLLHLVQRLSVAEPEVVFFARGMGEEPSDVWFSVLSQGRVIRQNGPFDSDLPEEDMEADTAESAGVTEGQEPLLASSTDKRPWWKFGK